MRGVGRDDAAGALEQVGPGELDAPLFAAGHGVAADELGGVGQELLAASVDNRPLGAADVGHDGTRQGMSPAISARSSRRSPTGVQRMTRSASRHGGLLEVADFVDGADFQGAASVSCRWP